MQLFVRSTQTYMLDVTDSSTAEDVKNLVHAKEGFPLNKLNIYYAGKPLTNEDRLSRLENLTTLDVQVRIIGGKIHGSINHAGKVKGLTERLNVEKQEKRKSKTGRAKRRMQYNRRFVDAVPTFGKKKGPNANS